MKGLIGDMRGAFGFFFHSAVGGSIALMAATIAALFWANSPWSNVYFSLLNVPIGVSWAGQTFSLSLKLWVNDGLMVVFFFVIGLEIKRELLTGHLSSLKAAALPVAAAAGGMVVPAAIYAFFNAGTVAVQGWGIPMATDIAFALGILALLGERVPLGLKVFLTALAIADDLGAVLVIALFYTKTIGWSALAIAAVFLMVLLLAARINVRRAAIYLILSICIWAAVFSSGLHPTVAGILVALIVPVRARMAPEEFLKVAREKLRELESSCLTRESMLRNREQLDTIVEFDRATTAMRPPGITLEHRLHPFQAYVVLPVFALCNAGLVFDGTFAEMLTSPVSLGILLGLVLGKQVGILVFSWAVVRSGAAVLPRHITWPQLYGAACIAGIGFTMSLFISGLAFQSEQLLNQTKTGVLGASLVAAVWGYLVLLWSLQRSKGTGQGPQSVG